MEDSESRIELVAFLQLCTMYDQGWCFHSVMGKEIQSRFPLRHPKTDTCLHLLGYLHMCPSVRMEVSSDQLDPLGRRCYCARCGVWCLTSVTGQATPQTATTYVSEQCLFPPEHTSPEFPCIEDHGPFARYMDCLAVGSLKALTHLLLLRDR